MTTLAALENAPRYEQKAREVQALTARAFSESWSYAELLHAVEQIDDWPRTRLGGGATPTEVVRAWIGGESDYLEAFYTTKGLRARWPDGWREAARVVPNSARRAL